jgi:eukaryotic-like serine/threonine-protein kinase
MKKLKYIALKGQGYFCIVKQYLDESTGNEFALKELKKEHYPKEEYRYRLNREISILTELQGCHNIIDIVDSGHDTATERLWYLMPFAKQNLYDFIKRNNSTIDKETRFNFVEQIISAIKFAHNKGILHRDISPNNVLVFMEDGKVVLKVSDFGLGKDFESLSFYTASSASGYGQVLYVSPEQRSKLKDATKKSDIYSLGKLVYFIFTGKDPDNLKPFELSSLVSKSTEENPEDRFANIHEFETHFHSLKDLQLNQEIAVEYLTLREVVQSADKHQWIQLHELLVKGNYLEHVYDDYISPVNSLLLNGKNLQAYYAAVGNSIRDFARTYSERLNECYQTVRWPFSSMETFGSLLVKIVKTVTDDETRLICFKQLWYLAFEADQWSVQREIKAVFNTQYITPAIETQLAEYIIKAEIKLDMKHFSSLTLPKIIKASIIMGSEQAQKKEAERKAKQDLEAEDLEW